MKVKEIQKQIEPVMQLPKPKYFKRKQSVDVEPEPTPKRQQRKPSLDIPLRAIRAQVSKTIEQIVELPARKPAIPRVASPKPKKPQSLIPIQLITQPVLAPQALTVRKASLPEPVIEAAKELRVPTPVKSLHMTLREMSIYQEAEFTESEEEIVQPQADQPLQRKRPKIEDERETYEHVKSKIDTGVRRHKSKPPAALVLKQQIQSLQNETLAMQSRAKSIKQRIQLGHFDIADRDF